MIISRRHKMVFIKTAKTGGSTLENILGKHLSNKKDIASGSAYKDSFDPKVPPTLKKNWRELRYPDNLGGDSHVPASFIYDKWFDGKRPKDYFVFTIERNSYEKAVSHWWWHTHSKRLVKQLHPSGVSFKDHLTRLLNTQHKQHLSCWHRYTKDDRINVDRVYQYDQWEEMWRDLSTRLKVGEIDMKKTRNIRLKNSHKPFDHYREAYSDNGQEIELVYQLCKKEIKYFKYKF